MKKLLILASLCSFSTAAPFQFKNALNCTGDPDGFTLQMISPHLIVRKTGGVEAEYFRVKKSTNNYLEAELIFDGYPDTIDGKFTQLNQGIELKITKSSASEFSVTLERPKNPKLTLHRTCKN